MYYPLNSCLIFLFLFTLIYHIPYASSKQEYGWCETTQFQCGSITAGFPFWGGNRPEPCGRASLELHCRSKNVTSLSISNHEYNVFNINPTSRTVRLVRADLLRPFCSSTFNTTTLPPEISELSPSYKSLTIFYHCNPSFHYVSSYTCPQRGVISAYQNPIYQRSCQENFTVNVPKTFVPEKKELNMTHLESVLREGFEVMVNTDELTCEGCSSSPIESYERCSEPFPCGNQGSLLYPFWVRGREDCGHPDFKLDCSKGFAELNLSSVKFRILEANNVSHVIKIGTLDYFDNLCLQHLENATFPETVLPLASRTKMLTIYYDCPNLSSNNVTNVYVGDAVCVDYEEARRRFGPNTHYYVTRNISSPLPDLGKYCSGQVSIPVSGSALNTMRLDNLQGTLAKGFEVQLNQDCSMCLESKGACGYNKTSTEFVCYCKDGTYGDKCGSGKKSHGALNKAIRIVLGSVAGVVLFLVLLTLFLRFLRIRETRLKHQKLKALIPLEHYTYAQVKRITKSFAEVVGTGGFGIVYRGTLSDGRMVAVKVLKDSKGNGEDFINEVASMSRTSHLNIVSLLGFCSEGSKRAIIYEFLGNGSLDKFISSKNSVNMDWEALYRIALGVARGLEYLHHGCKTRIVHFDIKPQNVLLDDNFCPKVSDFGLAKLCEKKESILSLLDTRGTVGYIAPEMISRVYGNVSHKSDVYSYGMLVLEMIGARNKEKYNQASSSNTSSMYFPEWVYRDLELGKSRRDIEDGINNEEDELAKKMTLVGLWCIQPSPLDRPPMNRVVEMMEGSLGALEVPPRPVFQIPTVAFQESSTFSEDTSVYTQE
ncbi:PREDICTED: LEAF RUST 10 DISEASE-RESISTANCE LOCUS RECEPTOR-LIKE PROTEIN KINASE-like 2.7 [Camelina sativa]|uniref:non-specific serine/threonine protein kinase n=1 Tax=Camelina sativa TaxID=90675 RepID=A0ABM0SRV7_CAMSA|nr:PREDICTED: LEAF RUST 10 DISEASE-RESISTANCE LOCUS RECEPTOR-LIKE PROTEIN KINASE-like 2.7 [Camelina sativa]